MHPPAFCHQHLLSDWPDCCIELRCQRCKGRSASYPVKLLMERHGDHSFSKVMVMLRCVQCGKPPAPAYLCASQHRQGGMGGPPPDWAVELVPEPGAD